MSKFDPYTFNYKAYISEVYDLTEMPERLSNFKTQLDDTIWNHEEGIRIESKVKFLEKLKIGEHDYRLYYELEEGHHWYYLLYIDKPFVCAEYSYNDISNPINAIETQSIWNHKWYRGLARRFFEQYILERFPSVVSDKALTEMGLKFWKTLFDDTVGKTHTMYIMDFNTGDIIQEIKQPKDMDQYCSLGGFKYRFVLSRK